MRSVSIGYSKKVVMQNKSISIRHNSNLYEDIYKKEQNIYILLQTKK